MERYRLMEWLAYIATELHKGFGPLWNPNAPTETRQAQPYRDLSESPQRLTPWRFLTEAGSHPSPRLRKDRSKYYNIFCEEDR